MRAHLLCTFVLGFILYALCLLFYLFISWTSRAEAVCITVEFTEKLLLIIKYIYINNVK